MFDVVANIDNIDFNMKSADAYYTFTFTVKGKINEYMYSSRDIALEFNKLKNYITQNYSDLTLEDTSIDKLGSFSGYIYTPSVYGEDGYPYTKVENILNNAAKNYTSNNKLDIELSSLKVYYGFSLYSHVLNTSNKWESAQATQDLAHLYEFFSEYTGNVHNTDKVHRDSNNFVNVNNFLVDKLDAPYTSRSTDKNKHTNTYATMTVYVSPTTYNKQQHMTDNIMFEDAAANLAQSFDAIRKKQYMNNGKTSYKSYRSYYDINFSGNAKKQLADHMKNKHTSKLDYWSEKFANYFSNLAYYLLDKRMYSSAPIEKTEDGELTEELQQSFSDVLYTYFDAIHKCLVNLSNLQNKTTYSTQERLDLITNTQEVMYGLLKSNDAGNTEWEANVDSLYNITANLVNYYENNLWPTISHRKIVDGALANAYIKTFIKTLPESKRPDLSDPEVYKNVKSEVLSKLYAEYAPISSTESLSSYIEDLLSKILQSSVDYSDNGDYVESLHSKTEQQPNVTSIPQIEEKISNLVKQRNPTASDEELEEKISEAIRDFRIKNSIRRKLKHSDKASQGKYEFLFENPNIESIPGKFLNLYKNKDTNNTQSFYKYNLFVKAALSPDVLQLINLNDLAEGMVSHNIDVFWKPYNYLRSEGAKIANDVVTNLYNEFKNSYGVDADEATIKDAFNKKYDFNVDNIFNFPEPENIDNAQPSAPGDEFFREESKDSIVNSVTKFINELNTILSYRLGDAVPKILLNPDPSNLKDRDWYAKFIEEKNKYEEFVKKQKDLLQEKLTDCDTMLEKVNLATEDVIERLSNLATNKALEKKLRAQQRTLQSQWTILQGAQANIKKKLFDITKLSIPILRTAEQFLEENERVTNTGRK